MRLNKNSWKTWLVGLSATVLSGCYATADSNSTKVDTASVDFLSYTCPYETTALAADPADLESRVQSLLAGMTLDQKIGQMVQPEIKSITPEEAQEFFIGSVLNGGGSWPDDNKDASLQDWLDLNQAYWEASTHQGTFQREDGTPAIPIIWGTDAVHGHNNVKGATLFPHNIGLGAARTPDLMGCIGAVTAREVAVTGLDWAFAPTLAVARDDRWGRTYEGFSEEPSIVKAYAGKIVEGLQGNLSDAHVVATAKHWIGDGGTTSGKDQGNTEVTEDTLRSLHMQGYITALEAGVQTVMASFNSWNGEKAHGHEYLLTDLLKRELGFEGYIISDWNGHGQVEGCSNESCAQAINAGIDMIMVPNDWKAFIENTKQQVEDGTIPVSRIDDAVSRILRVKLRAGLMDQSPSQRALAGETSIVGSDTHREVAREAVRRSLVLLKNKNNLLPLGADRKVLVAGKGADSLMMQTGGWTLSWQGTGNTNDDFPGATSIWEGINASASQATLSEDGSAAETESFDVAIVVIGETPYAEGQGDISKFGTLTHNERHPEDLALVEKIADQGIPVVTVFLTGRPLHVNGILNRSDAFVSAWLPGSEGTGVADVLFRDASGNIQHDFQGRLSFSWPRTACQTPLNVGDDDYDALFPFGYGLTYSDTDTLGDGLPAGTSDIGCDAPDPSEAGTTEEPQEVYSGGAVQEPWTLYVGDPSNWGGSPVGETGGLENLSVTTVDGSIQGSAKRVVHTGTGQFYAQNGTEQGLDLAAYGNSNTSIQFRIQMRQYPSELVNLAVHCVWPCASELALDGVLSALPLNTWSDVSVPLQCFLSSLDLTNVNTPFLMYTEGTLEYDIENIRWVPNTADAEPDCSVYQRAAVTTGEAVDVGNTLEVYTDGVGALWDSGLGKFEENADKITIQEVAETNRGTVLDLNFSSSVEGSGVVYIRTTTAKDLSAWGTTGTLEFDLKVLDFGSNTNGLIVKIECGFPCQTGDFPITSPTVGEWTSYSLSLQEMATNPNASTDPAFTYNLIDTPFVIFPAWGDQNGVHLQVDNIRWVLPE